MPDEEGTTEGATAPDESGEKPEGKEGQGVQQVDLSNYIRREQVDKIVEDRVTKARKELGSELLNNDDFIERVKKIHGLAEPSGEDDQKLDDQQVQELHEAWQEKDLVPVKEERDSLKTQVQSLRRDKLESQLLSAAAGKVVGGLLKGQANGHSALFNMSETEFEFDDDAGEWRVLNDQGHYRPSSTGDRAYMTPEEWFNEVWVQDQDNADLVVNRSQGGSDFRGGPSEGGKRVYSKAEFVKKMAEVQQTEDWDQYKKLTQAEREGRVR